MRAHYGTRDAACDVTRSYRDDAMASTVIATHINISTSFFFYVSLSLSSSLSLYVWQLKEPLSYNYNEQPVKTKTAFKRYIAHGIL